MPSVAHVLYKELSQTKTFCKLAKDQGVPLIRHETKLKPHVYLCMFVVVLCRMQLCTLYIF